MTRIIDQQYQMIKVDQVRPHPRNANQGDVGAISESIKNVGFYGALIIQKSTGQILAGEHRWRAAQHNGIAELPGLVVDVDDNTAARILIGDNRYPQLASWNEKALADLLADLARTDDGLSGTGYDGDDLDELIASLDDGTAPPDGKTDPDDIPDLPADPRSKVGDLWLLGPHRLVCGDSTEARYIEAALDGRDADCVWTDPPYGVAYVGKTKDALTIQNDTLTSDSLRELLRKSLGAAAAASKPGGAWYVAAPPGPLHLEFAVVLRDLDIWRQTVMWVKDQFVLGRSDYHYRHEPIFYGWTPGAAHQPPPDRKQDTVWEIPRPKQSKEHPTMKPVELVIRALENSTGPRGLILDPFGGSGTTLIAAHRTGRVAALVELDPHYADVICRRYQEHTGTLPIHATTGEPVDFSAS